MPPDLYGHRQTARWLRALLGWSAVFVLGGLVLLGEGLGGAVRAAAGAVACVSLLAGWIFGSLRVQVSPERVRVSFGPGWIARWLPTARLVSVEPMRSRWWHGWGIRYTPRGWLWNVSGFDAVLLALDDGRRFGIGTDEPEALTRALLGARPPR